MGHVRWQAQGQAEMCFRPPERVESALMNTLSEALESLVRRGFTEHFGVRGDQLHGFESGRTFGANDVTIREYDRFEGVSDPDDMAIVYAIESSSGTRGTLVDALACIRIRRSAHTWDVFGLPARDMRSRAPAAGGCFRLSSLEDPRTVAQRISNVRGGGSPPMS